MRVLVITPWFPTKLAPGSGIFNLRDVEMLAQDHEVTVLHLHDPALPGGPENWRTDSGIPVHRGIFSSARPDTWLAAVRVIRKYAADAEIVHTMAFPALFPVMLSRSSRAWVHTEHWSGLTSVPSAVSARVGGAALRPVLRLPNEVVAVGEALAQSVNRYRRKPATVIGNSVRLADAGVLPDAPSIRGGTPLRLIGVGHLIPEKGPLEAVEAVAAIRRLGIEVSLRWAGNGPLAASMLERSAELGVEENVELLGHVSPERLSTELSSSHVFVLPTEGETFGVAIAEALGHGLPVVTSGTGGHLDFLLPEVSRVVRNRSGQDIADAVIDLVNDSHRLDAARIASFARNEFSEERRRAAYREVYEDAVNSTQKR